MTHVVSENCIKCKYTDCVDVCPVDCFREGPNMLVIDPDECIDCAVCIPECPANAIFAEEDLPADLIDALPHAGGQCVELYGDKPIYDIPGIPVCTGRELAALLLQQIAPFKTQWHLNTLVSALTVQADGRLQVETSQGAQLLARTVFIAAGVGAF